MRQGYHFSLDTVNAFFIRGFCTFNSQQTIGRTKPLFQSLFRRYCDTSVHIVHGKALVNLALAKALVNLALANTSNQAVQRYTIQGHNILNEQDREIKNTTQLTQDTEVHDTRQHAAVNVKLTHTNNHHPDDEATSLSNSATIPSVLESDEEMDEYHLDDDVRDPDWKHEKNAKDNLDSNDEDGSGENNDISGKGINEVDHEETVEANVHESQETVEANVHESKTSSASKRKLDRCSLKQKNKKLRMQGDAYLGMKKNDQGVKTHCKERAGRLLCPSG